MAQPSNGRRHQDKDDRLLHGGHPPAEISQDLILAQSGAALVPIVIDNKGGGDVGDIGIIEEGKAAKGYPGRDPLSLLDDAVELLDRRLDPGLGGGIGQFGDDDGVTLVVGG